MAEAVPGRTCRLQVFPGTLSAETISRKQADKFSLNYDMPKSIGKARAFNGSFAVLSGHAYILANGADG